MRFWIRLIALLSLVVGMPACGAGMSAPDSTPGAPAASAAVERFLQLANEKRYAEMAWVFGTSEGPFAADASPTDAELRMYLFSCLLRHDSYEIRGQQPIPGTADTSIQYNVALTRADQEILVPFTLVRASDSRWYVENVQMETLTGSQVPLPEDCERSVRL